MGALRLDHEQLDRVFTTAYTLLAVNALVVLACSPLVAVLLTTDVERSWPLLALLSPLVGPAVAAAFGVFAASQREGRPQVVRTFLSTWRASFRRAGAVAAVAAALLVVLAVDVAVVWGHAVGAAAIPVLAVLACLVVGTALVSLCAVTERPGVRLVALVRASLFLGVRTLPLAAVSLAAVAVLATLVLARPALGLGLALAPALYLVWANCRYALRPVLAEPAAAAG